MKFFFFVIPRRLPSCHSRLRGNDKKRKRMDSRLRGNDTEARDHGYPANSRGLDMPPRRFDFGFLISDFGLGLARLLDIGHWVFNGHWVFGHWIFFRHSSFFARTSHPSKKPQPGATVLHLRPAARLAMFAFVLSLFFPGFFLQPFLLGLDLAILELLAFAQPGVCAFQNQLP